MSKILEGSRAIAETINNCRPSVVAAYPITPQTHIVEELAQLKADGQADFEYVRAESEFAAASIVAGASAAGGRTYTATSSQGLLLMTEVLFNIAGLRLPVVMTDANRAVSAPINIWNDQQDIMVIRDAGWLMLFGETIQEVCDLHILAFKVAEEMMLPAVVNLDGFVLTHVVEPVIIETSEKIKTFLPAYQPPYSLNVNDPATFGAFLTPDNYFEMRQKLHEDLIASQVVISQEMKNWQKIFGRRLSLLDYQGPKNPETVLVAMGSILGTIRDAVDELPATAKSVGILKITSFRPFPDQEIIKILKNAKNIAVIDKSISLGTEGILATEMRRALGATKKIISFVTGLGGRDVTKAMIKKIIAEAKSTKKRVIWMGKII